MPEKNLFYLLALHRAPHVGDIMAKKLIAACGSAEAVFRESRKNLLNIEKVGEYTVNSLFRKENLLEAEQELSFICDHAIHCNSFQDPDYPDALRHSIDGPLLLFTEGNYSIENKKIISIVGTRHATRYGMDFCEKLVAELAVFDPVIVSGLAYGIDICAHRAALNNNLQTIACLAHGLPFTYPSRHRKDRSLINENGGCITDFWSTDKPERNNFLKRNRVIAGLSLATIVIESGEKGGSLVTADIAHSYDREVFAVPGKPADRYSRGCNDLIKSQKAHMLTSAADLVYMLGWNIEKTPKQQRMIFPELEGAEKSVYELLLEKGKMPGDEVALLCGLSQAELMPALLSLEMKGMVNPLPGKCFEPVMA
ncbi:DNA-processing protein DprA [Robertkochia aurantiaca]|uniref:DNA-processing protein DprA n=1 Tax=Robertkochia aurantiaca TaxID=2873700 RepID=UPI001CC94C77|nr:DNA-processing protein DprA [Robertkochia sp. 3YJGBD-33]